MEGSTEEEERQAEVHLWASPGEERAGDEREEAVWGGGAPQAARLWVQAGRLTFQRGTGTHRRGRSSEGRATSHHIVLARPWSSDCDLVLGVLKREGQVVERGW